MFAVNRRYITDFDWPLLIAVLLIASFGLLEISSAEPVAGLWKRQAVGILIGLVVIFVTTTVDYRIIVNHYGGLLYWTGIVLLILVLTPLGKEVNGNRNWLDLGPVGFQPSEFAKLFTIVYLASYSSKFRFPQVDLRSMKSWPVRRILEEIVIRYILPWVKMVLIWALPTGLVFLENDTGSALSYISFLGGMFLLLSINWRWLVAGLVVILLLISLALPLKVIPYLKSCPGYKCERIRAVYWPELAEKRFRYQNEQAEIAVGSGGIFGKGLRGSTQGTLGFVPEVHNDFIYAVASEEWGFIGASLVLVGYLFIILRLIGIAKEARERLGSFLVIGFATLLLYHVTVNVGMVVRLLPIMGIPLPLMSHGSTSVIATFFGLGLAINVRLRRFVN
jgi:rod shape determining protein RodA